MYNIWDGRVLVAGEVSFATALEILSGYDLNYDESVRLLHRAGEPDDLAIQAFGLTVQRTR